VRFVRSTKLTVWSAEFGAVSSNNTNNAELATPRMMATLIKSGIRVDRLSVSEVTLEDVFLGLEKAEAS
jgi:hypothetical protein